jgi:hypothetical protein
VKRANLAVTSIPPARPNRSAEANARSQNRLARSVASFAANGFEVVSVNRAAEIPMLQGIYHGVGFLEAIREGLFGDRYGPSFGSVFEASRQTRICAVLNADVYLVRSRIADVLERNPRTFYVARRADIVDYGKAYVGTYTRGIDAFFFRPEHHSPLMDDPDIAKLQLGAPMWDIAIPVIASFHADVEFIEPPFLLHPVHQATWSRPDYDRLRVFCADAILRQARVSAPSSLNARRFLRVIEANLGRLQRVASGRQAKLFMRLANFWLVRIEQVHSVRIELNAEDPVLGAAIIGLDVELDHLAGWESLPEARAPRWPLPIEAARAALRRWKRARQTKRWNRLFDEAEQRFAGS